MVYIEWLIDVYHKMSKHHDRTKWKLYKVFQSICLYICIFSVYRSINCLQLISYMPYSGNTHHARFSINKLIMVLWHRYMVFMCSIQNILFSLLARLHMSQVEFIYIYIYLRSNCFPTDWAQAKQIMVVQLHFMFIYGRKNAYCNYIISYS